MSYQIKVRGGLKLFAVLGGLLLLLGLAAVSFPERVLTVDSGATTADAIVVLGGGVPSRPDRAAELFKAGEALRILVSGTNDCDWSEQVLETNGVPAAAIERECESRSTFENAKFSIPLLRRMGAHRVIIVTSWFHSRRAQATFEHLAPDIKFFSRPSYFGYDAKNRGEVQAYMRMEYPKLIGYWGWHGVAPF